MVAVLVRLARLMRMSVVSVLSVARLLSISVGILGGLLVGCCVCRNVGRVRVVSRAGYGAYAFSSRRWVTCGELVTFRLTVSNGLASTVVKVETVVRVFSVMMSLVHCACI